MKLRKYGWLLALLLVGIAYWLAPISGQVVIVPEEDAALPWPRFWLEPPVSQPGEPVTVRVTDTQPWPFVLLTVDGVPARSLGGEAGAGGTWHWQWTFSAPESEGYALDFYHDCHLGCVARGRITVGEAPPPAQPAGRPTKLGVVFPNPERDWRGRAGWAVEVVYARLEESAYWGVDDLATRVAAHQAQGLRVLVRVDYEQEQSLPPTGDYLALTAYLDYLQRLARDDRLQGVYGFIIGTDYNTAEANALADTLITPEWYARLFNGYGEDVTHSDNAVQVIRAKNPATRVLIGPVRPWSRDQDGALQTPSDVPWLNYFNTLVARLDEAAQAKAAAGIPLARPDGFDVQSPGRPDAPEMAGHARADEPRADLPRAAWDGAQAGFRIYRDWLDIINTYPSTRGLPVYIVSTNTYDRQAQSPPAQNYPRGWLTTALEVINAEPQVVALCWFLDDFPHDTQWDWFSLTQQPGRLVDAAEEFDALLAQP